MDVFSATRIEPQSISLNADTTAVLIVDMLHDFCDPSGPCVCRELNGFIQSKMDSSKAPAMRA